VFTTGENAISGSAVCKIRLNEVLQVFDEGKFKRQASLTSNWLAVPKSEEPKPRPGSCSSRDEITAESASFALNHPLMDQAVGGREKPVFLRTSSSEELTVVAADEKADSDVLFLGTSMGRVLKVYKTLLVEEAEVFPAGIPVRNAVLAG